MTSAKTIFTTRGCNGSLPGPPPKRDLRRHVPVYHTPFFWTRLPEILSLHTRPPGLARNLLPRASFRARGGGLSAWMERAGQPGRAAAARSCCLRREQLDPTWTEAGLACYRRLRRALKQQSRSTRMPRARPFACLRMGARTNSWPLRAKHERRARRAPGVLRRPVHRARHGRQQERRRRQARFPLSSTRFLHLPHSCICRRSASYCEPGASAAQISPTANNLMSTLDTDHTPRTYHTVTYHTHTGVRLPPKCRPSGWHWGRDAAFGQS